MNSGLAVAAQVLVAEAAGDLEVAVDAGDHQQLLELLGALRQGVDVPGLECGGTMKSRAPSGVDLMSSGVSTSTKPARVVHLADRLHEPRAQHEALVIARRRSR